MMPDIDQPTAADLERSAEADLAAWEIGEDADDALPSWIRRARAAEMEVAGWVLKAVVLEDRARDAEAEVVIWRQKATASSRGFHDRMAGKPETACPYPPPATPEAETSERAGWGIGWREADVQLRLAEAEAERADLLRDLLALAGQADLLPPAFSAARLERLAEAEAELARLRQRYDALLSVIGGKPAILRDALRLERLLTVLADARRYVRTGEPGSLRQSVEVCDCEGD